MSANYQAIQWNKFKRVYDYVIVLSIITYIAVFFAISYFFYSSPQDISPAQILIRALGTCALSLLHLILAIGPMSRISSMFKPFLYNRRHLGVSMFIVATAHAALVIIWYHGYGIISPLLSLFVSNPLSLEPLRIPFEFYGIGAYLILLIMALTSHDFWLKFFGAPIWKLLHMGVYIAYGLIIAHVVFGFIQNEEKTNNIFILGATAGALCLVHLIAAIKEFWADRRISGKATKKTHWVDLCPPQSIENNKARGFSLSSGDKIAVFRYDKKFLVAVANACAHQNGPLCEGRFIDGKIVCPWHGYEYIATTGRSPAPFTEKIATYNLRIRKGMVQVNAEANPPGTQTKPAIVR